MKLESTFLLRQVKTLQSECELLYRHLQVYVTARNDGISQFVVAHKANQFHETENLS